MPYYPLSGSGQQYFKSSGGFALNYYLKFYIAGTNTAISCAPNATATDDNSQPQLLDKVRINERGYPVNPTGGEIVPHVDQAYKLVLFKSAADANADNTSAADWTIDNLSPGLVGFALTQNDQDSTEIDYLADATASTRKLDTRLKERVSVLDFAADNTGVVDCTVAIATAFLTSLDIYIPSGTYLTSGIEVIRNNQSLHFGANVFLKAAANNNVLFKQTTSYCRHTGGFTTNSNGKSGVKGMIVGPADLTSTTTLSYQIDNVLPIINGDGGLSETVQLQAGPTVGGSYSKNYKNYFPLIESAGSVRALFFEVPSNANTVLTSNNVFKTVSTNGYTSTNTGIHIASGSHNVFQNVSLKDITSNGSPNTTATGLFVSNTCSVSGQSNSSNTVVSGSFVSCNRDINNSNMTTSLPAGVDFDYSNSLMTAVPLLPVTTGEPLKIYVGEFNNTASVHAPPGWSVSRTSTGQYLISHNIGNTDYVVQLTGYSNDFLYVEDFTKTSTSFAVVSRGAGSISVSDARFFYTVIAH